MKEGSCPYFVATKLCQSDYVKYVIRSVRSSFGISDRSKSTWRTMCSCTPLFSALFVSSDFLRLAGNFKPILRSYWYVSKDAVVIFVFIIVLLKDLKASLKIPSYLIVSIPHFYMLHHLFGWLLFKLKHLDSIKSLYCSCIVFELAAFTLNQLLSGLFVYFVLSICTTEHVTLI